MALDVRIDGGAKLRQVAAQIRAAGDKGLGREMGRALTKALAPLDRAIEAEAAKVMPSGYAPTLTASLRHRRSTRIAARTASVRLTTTGAGKQENRDLPALNRGVLRHPVYGRSRPLRGGGRRANPWAATRIKPGFYDRGTASAADESEKQLLVVLDDFAERLAKG